jgi:RimJ/RimL family protein N-acetyltransferase
MSTPTSNIPDLTLETISRTFFREATGYGFGPVDYVKFANLLLDMAMKNGLETKRTPSPAAKPAPVAGWAAGATAFPLQGARVVVRAFDAEADLPLFDRWLADRQGRFFLLSRTTSRRSDIGEVVETENCVLGIITLPDSTPIGAVGFLDYDPTQRKAELRKLIGEPAQRGKGFAREASALWIQYGLEVLQLKKIYLNTLETDIRNVKLNEELGFAVEGILRNEVLVDGTYRDVLRMGLWRE